MGKTGQSGLTRADHVRNICEAYANSNGSKAEERRVVTGLKALGFDGAELVSALRALLFIRAAEAVANGLQKGEH